MGKSYQIQQFKYVIEVTSQDFLFILVMKYRKIPIISPGLIFVEKAFGWAYFRGSLFSEGHIIGRNFVFQDELGLTIKTA